jgi:hypothetical protein
MKTNGAQGIQGPQGPRGIPGTGHITIYNIPPGHDGWVYSAPTNCNAPFCNAGPLTSSTFGTLGQISGTDLGNITSQSFVWAEPINEGVSGGVMEDNGVALSPQCTVWDVFNGGFHAYCQINTLGFNSEVNLRVVVINP